MANLPKKPQKGQPSIQAIYDSVCEIIDYLPSLTVTGDNKTTSVNHSMYGTTIHAIQPSITTTRVVKGGEGGETYYPGSGITINSSNVISIIAPPDNTKNYALVCLSGQIQWVELEDC